MTGRRTRARRDAQRGAAAVEFALIAPILIFLLFAIIGFGYMLSFRQALSQGASEGARAIAVSPVGVPGTGTGDTKETRARDAINGSLGSYGVTCTASGQLQRVSSGANAGTCVITLSKTCAGTTGTSTCASVALDYAYRDNSLLPSVPGLGIVLPTNLKYTAEVEINTP